MTMPATALDFIHQGRIIVASDTAEYLKTGEFHPQDATTNPSLVLAAVTKPEYTHLIDLAVRYAQANQNSVELRTELALDYLLAQVGVQILNLIPGRVSVSVDPGLAYDHDAMVNKGRALISLLETLGVPRERVLIKIPATYQGILAARTLETPMRLADGSTVPPIHTNATLVFGLVQALACAQAGISVISPFIGRVKDWWAAHEVQTGGNANISAQPLSEHPGILLVQRIRSAYTSFGYSTQIMAAGLRSVDEIMELGKRGAKGGPDIITLPPELLVSLRRTTAAPFRLDKTHVPFEVDAEPRYITQGGSVNPGNGVSYAEDLASEMIARDKVPEGLAKFSADAKILKDLIRSKVMSSMESRARL